MKTNNKCSSHKKYKAVQKPRNGCVECEQIFIRKIVSIIANKCLNIPTLESRNMDSLDFHEVSIWNLESALKLAYRVGNKDINNTKFNEFWKNNE